MNSWVNRMWIAGIWLFGAAAFAAEPAFTLPRRIDVPADRPDLWWNSALVGVRRDEIEQLLDAARPRPEFPSSVVPVSAVYEATLQGHVLVGGKFRLLLQRSSSTPVWHPLAPLNVALSGVSWSDREAVAGTAADGQFWVWHDRPESELLGGWSARGVAIGDRTEFHLQLPEAVQSTIRLLVPAGSKVRVDNGLAKPPDAPSANGWETWDLDLADPKSCRFQVVRPARESKREPLVLFRQRLDAEVREDHIRFQSRFEAEAWSGAVRSLRFSIPSSVELYAVSWGAETPLEWSRESAAGPRHTVVVHLPEAAQGALRPVVLEGIIGTRASGATVIPQLELVNGLFQSGQQTVAVMRPMQIAAVRMTGCRQKAPLLATADGETLTVEQLLPGALLTLDLRRPSSALSAHVLTQVDVTEPEVWTQISHVLLTANAGGVFQASVRLPREWEVTNVEAFNPTRGAERMTWERIEESGKTTLLRVEFFQAVTPTQPRLLRILARHRVGESVGVLSSPLPIPIDCTFSDAVLSLRSLPRFRPWLTGETSFREVDVDQMAGAWWRQPEWSGRVEPDPTSVWMRGTDLARLGSVRLQVEPAPARCRTATWIEVGASATVTERYRLELQPLGRACDRALVWLSESGPDVDWSVESPAGLQVLANRLPPDQLSLWDLPPRGDLWEIRLPEMNPQSLVLVGQRERVQMPPGRAALAWVPHADSFEGEVSFRAVEAEALDVVVQGLMPLGSAASDVWRTWRYNSVHDDLRWVSRSEPRQKSATFAEMTLRTLVSAPDELFDLHRAACTILSPSEPLRVQFPQGCVPLHAYLDGTSLEISSEGVVSLPEVRSTEARRLVLTYRTASPRGFLVCPRRISAPVCSDVVWTAFRWELSVPPAARLWSEPSGVRLLEPLPEPSWTERMFGPLGRSAREGVFWPLSPASWSELTSPTRSELQTVLSSDPQWAAPAGWDTHVALAPAPPAHLEFAIWRGDRIQLLAYVGALASMILGIGLRRAGWGFRDQVSLLILAALATAVWMAEPPLTQVIGAVWAGAIVALLVPRSWFDPAAQLTMPGDKAGSTQNFAAPPLAVTTLVLWGLVAIQPRAADPQLLDRGGNEPTVLVPVDRDGSPSRKLPLVYCSPAWLDSLRAAAANQPISDEPPWVFERAVYRFRLTHESPAAVFAAFDVLVSGHGAAVSIPLPIRGGLSGVASCRVDGRPAVLSTGADGNGLRVTVTRPDFPVSAIGERPLTRHTVMVELYRAWQMDWQGAMLSLRVPPVHVSRLLTEGTPAMQMLRFPTALGQPVSQENPGATTVDVGPVDELAAHWTVATFNPRRLPAECQLESAELLTAGPQFLQSRTRTVITPQSGAVRRLQMKLPPGAVLQNLETTPVVGYLVREDVAEGQVVEFDATADLRQPLVIRSQHVVPRLSEAAEFVWQGLRWTADEPVVWTVRQRVLGVAAYADLRVLPQSVDDTALAPLSLEGARNLIEDLIVDVRPHELYQLSSERPVTFRAVLTEPQRKILQSRHSGVFGKDRLTWTFEATLEAPPLPLYSHVISVDRRLQVESVLVRERNADRVLRWSEVRPVGNTGVNRITVFLSDPVTDEQTLVLVASLPLNDAATLELPRLRIDNAETVKSRLEVAADAAWQVEWNSLRGLKRIAPSQPADEPPASWEFDVQDADWRATVRIRPFDEVAAVRVLHLFVPAEGDSVELHSRMEIPSLDRGTSLTVNVPSPWEVVQAPMRTGVELEQHPDDAEGMTRLRISAEAATAFELRWQSRSRWSKFSDEECPLPTIDADGSRNVRIWLAELPSASQSRRLQPSIDESVLPPRWASQWLSELTPTTGLARWLGPLTENASGWPLVAAEHREATARIVWLEHQVWRPSAGIARGQSVVRMLKPVRLLTVAASEQIRIEGALVDGRPASQLATAEQSQQFSSLDGQLFQEARILWRTTESVGSRWSGLVSAAWPVFPKGDVAQQAVTVYPASSEWMTPLRGWTRSNSTDRILQRLESICDLLAAPDVGSRSWLVGELRTRYPIAVEKLGRTPESLGDVYPQRRERWQSVIEQMEQLPHNSEAAAPAVGRLTALDDLLVDHPAVLFGMLDPAGDVTWFWQFDRGVLRVLGAGLLFLLAMLVFRILQRPAWRNWLRSHPHGALSLLGLLWWLCLTPSILGLAVLIWSVFRAATATRAPATRATVA